MSHIQIDLIVRNGCHLCVAAQDDLGRVVARFAAEHPDTEYTVRVMDISDQIDFQRFTDEVPVLLINGKQEAFWRIDEDAVYKKLVTLV